MSQQIQITGGAKVRNLEGVLTGTSGVVNSLGINVPSGIPQLDGSGKILVSQLPNSVMEYKGTWNAATNTPTLADGTGNQGDVYLCNVAGTANFGSGPIAFFVGDQVIYSGTIWQRASGATGTVTSVSLTESGDSLNVTGSPITTSGTINIGFNGNSGQYINGEGNLTTFPSLAGYVTSVTATAPLVSSGGTTPNLSIPVATSLVDGYLDNADWTIFNNKQNAITLTTTGTSGAATLVGATLNIPNYAPDLSGYVTLATAQTISGAKTFTQNLALDGNGSNAGTLLLKSNSTLPTAIGYTGINSTSNSIYLTTFVSNPKTAAFDLSGLSDNIIRTFTFPNSSGTIALTSDLGAYVPYTGATANVDLGGFSLYFNNGQAIFGKNFAGSTAYALIGLNPSNKVSIDTSALGVVFGGTIGNGTYTYTLPSATGTLALTSNLSAYVPYTGATGAVNLGTNELTSGNAKINDTLYLKVATTYAHVSGYYGIQVGTNLFTINNSASTQAAFSLASLTTSRTFTLPDSNGTLALTSNLSAYLPLSGGTLTGALSGTSATFSDTVTINKNAAISSLIVKSSSSTTGLWLYLNGLNATLSNQDNGSLGFETNGTNRLTIASTGAATFSSSVTAGGFKSQGIPNGLEIIGPTGSPAYAVVDQSVNNGGKRWRFGHTGAASGFSSFDFYNQTDNITAMTLTSGGNVGIGTSSPAYKLDIQNGSDFDIRLRDTSLGGTVGILFETANDFSGTSQSYIKGVGAGNSGASDLIFGTGAGGGAVTATERMRITSGGNVLIGTQTGVSGGGALQVNGNVNINGVFQINGVTIGGGGGSGITGSGTTNYIPKYTTSTSIGNSVIYDNGTSLGLGTANPTGQASNNRVLQIYGAGTGNRAQLHLVNSNTGEGTGDGSFIGIDDSTNLYINNAENAATIFENNSGERMRLTPAGNLGVGTTSPESVLTVQKNTAGGRGGEISIVNYATQTLGNEAALNFGLEPSTYGANDGNAQIKAIITNGSTAGTDIVFSNWSGSAFSERMRIFANGNVGINRTTDAGYKFDVNGTGRFTGQLTGTDASFAGSVTATSGFFDTSDSRLKVVIKDYNQAKGIENVEARLYLKNNKKELGYFAQDVQEILPSAVSEGSDGFLTLSYSQVHTAKIAYLEDKVAQLEKLIKSLL